MECDNIDGAYFSQSSCDKDLITILSATSVYGNKDTSYHCLSTFHLRYFTLVKICFILVVLCHQITTMPNWSIYICVCVSIWCNYWIPLECLALELMFQNNRQNVFPITGCRHLVGVFCVFFPQCIHFQTLYYCYCHNERCYK